MAAAAAGGLAIGGVGIANAATSPTTATTAPGSGAADKSQGNEDAAHEKSESAQPEADEKAGRAGFGDHCGHGEKVVTGATAAKIKAAALAAVPGTVTKTEQRSDGTYEAEITKSDGTEVHVSLDKSFTVISQDAGHGSGRGETPGA